MLRLPADARRDDVVLKVVFLADTTRAYLAEGIYVDDADRATRDPARSRRPTTRTPTGSGTSPTVDRAAVAAARRTSSAFPRRGTPRGRRRAT